jgi:[acyl-carrier-protein] S-malonyltransferase
VDLLGVRYCSIFDYFASLRRLLFHSTQQSALCFASLIDSLMATFAFVFPGQGSQAVGMLDVWGDHPAVRQVLEEASQALGEDLSGLIHLGPKEQLDLTTNTQPVMLAAGIACYRAWVSETGLLPSVVAGHSLGEYSALVASGSLSLSEALPLVRFRAQAMQEAVPVGVGAMAAILGLDAQVVQDGCAAVVLDGGEVVEAVNFNDPKQTVIAGSKVGVERVCAELKDQGAKRALLLPVSAPFHSSLMKPAAERLKLKLAQTKFLTPEIRLINNIDVKEEVDVDAIRGALYRQAFGPVRWVETIQALRAQGVTHIIECGPGKVLSGLVRRIDPQAVSASIFDPTTLSEVKDLLS